MKQYRIQVNFGSHEYNVYGNVFKAIYEFIKNIDSGAYVKVTRLYKTEGIYHV